MKSSPTVGRLGQTGATAVEFAMISLFFFTLLLGIVELGRLMYVWNTVQEVTRRAAREAIVRNFNDAGVKQALQREAIFRANSSGVVFLPASPEISYSEVSITYLDENQSPISDVSLPSGGPSENISNCSDANPLTVCIKFVRAEICDATTCGEVLYRPLVGFLFGAWGIDFRVGIPISPVVMPAESLGFAPS